MAQPAQGARGLRVHRLRRRTELVCGDEGVNGRRGVDGGALPRRDRGRRAGSTPGGPVGARRRGRRRCTSASSTRAASRRDRHRRAGRALLRRILSGIPAPSGTCGCVGLEEADLARQDGRLDRRQDLTSRRRRQPEARGTSSRPRRAAGPASAAHPASRSAGPPGPASACRRRRRSPARGDVRVGADVGDVEQVRRRRSPPRTCAAPRPGCGSRTTRTSAPPAPRGAPCARRRW